VAATEQQTVQRDPEPKRAPRQVAPLWPKSSQVRQSVPVLRLISEIWAIPEVVQIGLSTDEDGVHVRVIITKEDRAVRSRVYATERTYLGTTPPHAFKLWVSPRAKVGKGLPLPFETVLER